MAENDWSWWVGDGERYHTECDTREEAVRIARDEYEGAWIVEATKPDNIMLARYFDADRFLEQADEQAWDDHADPESSDGVFIVTTEQRKSLEADVRAAIDKWQSDNGLVFQGFMFAQTRNEEYVE